MHVKTSPHVHLRHGTFLACVDRYVNLAGTDAKPVKHVSTPFYEERIARPVADEKEQKGVLAPIAARILMKILFAARMARFD